MSNKGLQGWLKKRANGSAPADLTAAEQEELARYDRLWEAAAPPPSSLQVDTEAAWSKLDDRLFGEEKVVPIGRARQRSQSNLWRIAAAITVLAVAAFSIFSYLKEPTAGTLAFVTQDQTEEITLPDGSFITLNKNSELTYLADRETRQVQLKGEAFFNVARDEDHPFTITTGELTTTVLGTAFNVRAYPDEDLEVSVKEGKVAVEAKEEKVVLVAKEAVVYQPAIQEMTEKKVAVVAPDVWKTQQLEFAGASLRDVLPVLERYYDQPITADAALLDCEVTSELHNFSLNESLELLTFTLGVEVETNGDTLHLTGAGCQ